MSISKEGFLTSLNPITQSPKFHQQQLGKNKSFSVTEQILCSIFLLQGSINWIVDCI